MSSVKGEPIDVAVFAQTVRNLLAAALRVAMYLNIFPVHDVGILYNFNQWGTQEFFQGVGGGGKGTPGIFLGWSSTNSVEQI
jgi:hypothetical protein